MGKSKRHRGRKARKSRRLKPPAPASPKSINKWLLIFFVIICVLIAGLWGIKSLQPGDEKKEKEQSPPILDGHPKPSTVPSKLTAEQEITALKEEEFGLSEKLLKEFPNSEVPLMLIGNIQRKYGNSAEAVKLWEKALELNPERPDAYNGMGWIAFEKGEYEKALAFWRKALEINPKMPAVHNSIAQTLIILGRYDEVIKEAEEELKITPRSGLSYFLLGQGYLKQKEYDKAKKYYETAIEIQPDYINAYYGLFTACSKLKLQDQAKKHLATFQKLKAEDRKVLMDRNKAFDDLVTIRKSLAETYSDAEKIYTRKGNVQEAEKFLRRAITLDSNNTEYLMKLGLLYQSNNLLQDALEMYVKVREIEPDHIASHMNTGVISVQLNQFANAEKVFQKVITIAPKFTGGYRELAHLYLRTGTKFPEALKLAKTAIELEETAAHYFILSWAYDKNGDVPNAISALKRAVELEPENPTYRRTYEQIQKRNSRSDS